MFLPSQQSQLKKKNPRHLQAYYWFQVSREKKKKKPKKVKEKKKEEKGTSQRLETHTRSGTQQAGGHPFANGHLVGAGLALRNIPVTFLPFTITYYTPWALSRIENSNECGS